MTKNNIFNYSHDFLDCSCKKENGVFLTLISTYLTIKQSHTSFCYGPKSPKAEEANEENYRFPDNSMLIKRSLDIRGTYSLRSNQDQFQF